MPLDILLTVAGTSIIQSILGVGVLLFGTPILLAFGYDFITSITILLPISLTINLFQIVKDYKKINTKFYKKIIFYSIPFLVLFLFVVATYKINIGMFVGIFLLIVAIKDYSFQLNNAISYLMKHEKIYLIAMGAIHGATNLGGSLLTAIIHSKKYEKNVTRATVAASYATFAAFQIATLLLSAKRQDINYVTISYCLMIGVIVFIITEKTVYIEINSKRYSKLFAIFLFSSGLLLCLKSL